MEKTEEKNSYHDQQKVAMLDFLTELPNFIAVTISAVASNSLIVWMDFVDSLGCVLNTTLVALLSRKLSKDLRYEYNYGVGKIESISALCCDGILVCGLIFMLFSSIGDLLDPQQPSGVLGYVALLKVVNVAVDAYFVRAQYRLKKTSRTAIAEVEFRNALKNIAFDSVALLSILIAWLLRDVRAAWYFSPVVCILMSCWFFVEAVRHVRESIQILTDRTLPEKDQMNILSVLSKFYTQYEDFQFLSTRAEGNTAYIDLGVTFPQDTTYAEIQKFCDNVTHAIEEKVENAKVSIIVRSDPSEH